MITPFSLSDNGDSGPSSGLLRSARERGTDG
jgi:hypothetical protein